MMRAICDNIVELSVIALIAFFFFGIGYLIIQSERKTHDRSSQCIEAQMQWVGGNCVR
jgi:hypothetical protein